VVSPESSERLDLAARVLGSRVRRDVPIGPMTTYRVGGSAALAFTLESEHDVALLARAVSVSGLPVLSVGRGSNLLVSDRGFAGLAVFLGPEFATIRVEDRHVIAGASVLLPVLARRTVAAALTGLEWAVGVPGTVGGAVRMNAGGHGSDLATSVCSARIARLDVGVVEVVDRTGLGLRFRGSALGDLDIVLSVDLALAPGDRERGEIELAEIVRWRREHQPGGQNAGSVFVNPVPGVLAAGAVIDELGLRGLRLGTAEVSIKHANFIQADEDGSADDVFALMRLVRSKVLATTGIALRSEIRLVGFADELSPAASDAGG
jgi:UDP-N-acetylmuramate dehydrogenase